MSTATPLDPRHGIHNPTSGTPARLPCSVRRTSTVDACYPDGPGGRMLLVGSARDLVTDAAGEPSVVAAADIRVDIRYEKGPTVSAIASDPPIDTSALVGRLASSGFRAVVDSSTDASPGTLVYLLLDEIPGATLVAGYSVMHATNRGDLDASESERRRPPGPPLQFPDLCAGWQTGGVIMTDIVVKGSAPMVTGPEAPDVSDPADPLAWHSAPPVAPDTVRRSRRIDLTDMGEGTIGIDVFFRDSHMAPGGIHTVLHEYTVTGVADRARGTIVECRATPQALPWIECPQAADSASRLAGVAFAGLRNRVRTDFVGPTTCTHLNDTLRGFEDVPHLVALIPS